MNTIRKQETYLFMAAWALIFFVMPLILINYSRLTSWTSIWKETWEVWRRILPFFVASSLHHFFLLRLLPQKKWSYLFCTLVLTSCIGIQQFTGTDRPKRPPFPGPQQEAFQPGPPAAMQESGPDSPPPFRQNRYNIEPELTLIILMILIFGVDVGLRLFFDRLRNERQMRLLQIANTKNELAALRYQINPHFFMNTLNNIHALVDIDPEKAKVCIEEFSKLMRVVLYGSNAQTIPLSQEMDFLSHYLWLMRLRHEDHVEIDIDFPEEKTDRVLVPPILLGSFLENAFKYGVSYREASWIRCSISIKEDHLLFRCENSVHADMQPRKDGGGLGLDNVRKRLDLLYQDQYHMDIQKDERQYSVLVELPFLPVLNA